MDYEEKRKRDVLAPLSDEDVRGVEKDFNDRIREALEQGERDYALVKRYKPSIRHSNLRFN